jgi:hypothetical protein
MENHCGSVRGNQVIKAGLAARIANDAGIAW